MKTPTYQHDTNRVLNTLDFNSGKPTILYSGYENRIRAETYANKNNLKTISHTEGGRYLEGPNRYDLHGKEKAKALWAAGSGKFASTVKGDVRTFVAGADPKGIFRQREIGAIVTNKDVSKVNGIDRQKLAQLYDKTYQKSMNQGIPHRDSLKNASTQTYRATAIAELRQARREAYQSADKKQIADYQKRKDAYLNQRVDDKQAMAKRQGIAYTGPQKKTPEQRTLDRKIDTRNMHARASLDKNIREGNVSKQDAPKEKARIEKTLSEYAKSDRSAFQAQETSKSLAKASDASKATVTAPSASAPKAKAM